MLLSSLTFQAVIWIVWKLNTDIRITKAEHILEMQVRTFQRWWFNESRIFFLIFVFILGENTIIVVSLSELSWWKLKLVEMEHPGSTIRADYLAISKTNSVLFFTRKKDTKLYSFDLEYIGEEVESKLSTEQVIVKLVR